MNDVPLVPLHTEGQPQMWTHKDGMPDPENAEPYEYEGRLYWIEKTAWSSEPVGQFTVSAVGRENVASAEAMVTSINELVAKARNLVELMNDAERNHGGLLSVQTLRARGELALELGKWAK